MFKFDDNNKTNFFSEPTKINKYRNRYFFIVEEAHKKTGYSKNEIHDMMKKEVLKNLNFNNKFFTTTNDLTEKEWPIFIDAVKLHIYNTMDLIF